MHCQHSMFEVLNAKNLQGRVDNESTSDSDEDAPGTSVALHSGSSLDARPVGLVTFSYIMIFFTIE